MKPTVYVFIRVTLYALSSRHVENSFFFEYNPYTLRNQNFYSTKKTTKL